MPSKYLDPSLIHQCNEMYRAEDQKYRVILKSLTFIMVFMHNLGPANMNSHESPASVLMLSVPLHCSKSLWSVCLICEISHVSSKTFCSVELVLNQLHTWETLHVQSIKNHWSNFYIFPMHSSKFTNYFLLQKGIKHWPSELRFH